MHLKKRRPLVAVKKLKTSEVLPEAYKIIAAKLMMLIIASKI